MRSQVKVPLLFVCAGGFLGFVTLFYSQPYQGPVPSLTGCLYMIAAALFSGAFVGTLLTEKHA